MSECDRCGLEDPECHCFLNEISDKVDLLAEELDKLTKVVNIISDKLKEFYER